MWEFDLVGCCIGLFGLYLLAVVLVYALLVVGSEADNHPKRKG